MSTLKEIYRAEQLPVFQNSMFHTQEEAQNCVMGDVVLVRDLETGLIFNQAFRPELMEYNSDYQNEQAVSPVFRAHLDEVTAIIGKYFSDQTLIEVGCGKGYFLEHLNALGYKITGLDPTYEGASNHILKAYFTPETGLNAYGIILRHVLEHVQNPVEFLRNIADSNGGGGKIYIEVPCIDWICEHRAWFDVFYEHVNYFRLSDFSRIFGKVYEAGHIFGGQYLYVVADLASLRMPRLTESDQFEFPADFLNTVNQFAELIKAQYTDYPQKHPAIIWGGASKGVVFALFIQRAGANIDFVIDINPAKQGKYLAGTGLKVCSPSDVLEQVEQGATIFVMNGNYLAEIKLMTYNQFNYLTVDHENI
jgi:SAM-dependent methyltransferase